MKEEQKDAFYISISDPVDFRKQILSSCKSTIIILKEFEKQREARKAKFELESLLGKKLKEISFLVNKLNGSLPRYGLRAVSKSRHDVPLKEKRLPEAKQSSHLAKLEKELESIERKMKVVSKL